MLQQNVFIFLNFFPIFQADNFENPEGMEHVSNL